MEGQNVGPPRQNGSRKTVQTQNGWRSMVKASGQQPITNCEPPTTKEPSGVFVSAGFNRHTVGRQMLREEKIVIHQPPAAGGAVNQNGKKKRAHAGQHA